MYKSIIGIISSSLCGPSLDNNLKIRKYFYLFIIPPRTSLVATPKKAVTALGLFSIYLAGVFYSEWIYSLKKISHIKASKNNNKKKGPLSTMMNPLRFRRLQNIHSWVRRSPFYLLFFLLLPIIVSFSSPSPGLCLWAALASMLNA